MSHIPNVKRYFPVGKVCDATATFLMGFFYAMYTTRTIIEKGFAIVDVYADNEYWHTYEFPVDSNYDYIEHITGKVWGTVGVLNEINNALKLYYNERMD